MDNRSEYIELNGERLHCMISGSGTRVVLAFHGYNNDATIFLPCVKELNNCTVISADMPHHGKSAWSEKREMSVDELKQFVIAIKEKYNADKISLLGYSMGGRICLKIAEIMPEVINRVVLIAPDGLRFNSFYYVLTRTDWGKALFKSFLDKPGRYMRLVNAAKMLRLIDESRYKFAMRYLQTKEARSFLYNVWPAMCQLIPDTPKLKAAINNHSIPVEIFMGKYDRIIPVSLAHDFARNMKSVKVQVLEKGHRVLDADTLPLITKCFS